MPQPYLLQVFSQPSKVSTELWKQWYHEEHIRDMVYFNASKTGSVYRVIAGPEGPEQSEGASSSDFAGEGKTFFACYQCEKAHPLKTLEYQTRVRGESELFDGKDCHDVADFQSLDLELTGTLGDAEKEQSAPFMVHIEARKDNGRHLNSWVVNEHLEAAKKIKGYRRTLFFRPNDGEAYDASEGSGHTVILDEFEELAPDSFESMTEALESSAAERQLNFKARALKLIEAEGFSGKAREPMRIS